MKRKALTENKNILRKSNEKQAEKEQLYLKKRKTNKKNEDEEKNQRRIRLEKYIKRFTQ